MLGQISGMTYPHQNTEKDFFLCFADRESQYNLSN